MDLNLLKTFISVYKHKSITVAAEELNVTQPAVSGSIKRLEALVNQRLFVRSGRGIEPTSSAISLAHKVGHPLSMLGAIDLEQQEIRVSCNEILMAPLSELEGVVLSETAMDEREVFEDLYAHKVDLAIVGMVTKQPSIVVEKIHSLELVCVTRMNHSRITSQITLDEYFAEQHIEFRGRRNELNVAENLSDSADRRMDVKVEVSSVTSMLAIASESDLVTIAPKKAAERYAQRFDLRIHDLPYDFEPVEIFMLYHRRFSSDPFHKLKRELVKDKIREQI